MPAKGTPLRNAGSNRSGIRMTSDTLTPGLIGFPPKLNAAIGATMHFYAPKVQSYARDNARWTDRTSNARNGLFAKAYHSGVRTHGIVLYHSMPYGIWLEVRWAGKYRIIVPTIVSEGPKVMLLLAGILRKMK